MASKTYLIPVWNLAELGTKIGKLAKKAARAAKKAAKEKS